MRFDTVIIGGGLAGLTAGISLQEAGRKVAIVSAGQNAMHFFSGNFEDACPVRERIAALFAAAGVRTNAIDGLQLMPMGKFKDVSLTLEDVTVFPDEHIAEKALIVNFTGFHDFYGTFLAETLEKLGISCRIRFVRLPEMEHLRTSPSEMRSVNIARMMDEHWEKVVADIRVLHKDEDLILLPQVFGLKDAAVLDKIRTALPARVAFIGTMPPSVPGIRTQMLLKRRFEVLGGTFLMGDEVTSAAMHEGIVSSITTRNLDTVRLFADHFILASGGFFSKGLASTPTQVYEPLFGLTWTSASRRTRSYIRSRTENLSRTSSPSAPCWAIPARKTMGRRPDSPSGRPSRPRTSSKERAYETAGIHRQRAQF